jgi:hypothetical protein
METGGRRRTRAGTALSATRSLMRPELSGQPING